MKKFFILAMSIVALSGCGKGFEALNEPLPPIGSPSDNWLVVDRAMIEVTKLEDGTTSVKLLPKLIDIIIPKAFAYNGSTPPAATLNAITYNNPATNVDFTLSQATTVGTYTNDVLSFGSFAITGLDDNTLRKCTVSGANASNGNNKCTQAAIRVYSASGDLNGSTGVFCNATDGYCVPLMVDGIAVGVASANAAYPQLLAIANNKNRLRRQDFTNAKTNFPVSMDMANAGSGSYSATLIVEYVLRIP